MNHFIISAYAVFLSALLAGVIFIWRGQLSIRLFGSFWLAVSFWSYFVAMQSRLLRWMPDVLWGWFLHVGCIFVPVIFFHFAYVWSKTGQGNFWSVRAVYAGGIVFVLLNTFTKVFTHGTVLRDSYAYPVPGILYPLYIVFFQIIGVWSTALILRMRNQLSSRGRRTLYLFLAVYVLAYVGSMDNFLIMYDLRIFPLYPYGLYFILPYVILGGYTVRKLGPEVGLR